MLMKQFEYAVLLTPAEEGGFVVTCRDLPELITQGEDVNDALNEARDAMDEVFAHYMRRGRAFPAPSSALEGEYNLYPPISTVMKAALYSAMQESRLTNVQLANQLGVDEKEVRRLLDPHHASKLPRIDKAISLLGKRLVVSLVSA